MTHGSIEEISPPTMKNRIPDPSEILAPESGERISAIRDLPGFKDY